MKMTRQEANRKILEILTKVVEAEPDWRFHQILQNIGIEYNGVDQWFDESTETLENCNAVMKSMQQSSNG